MSSCERINPEWRPFLDNGYGAGGAGVVAVFFDLERANEPRRDGPRIIRCGF